MKCWNPTWAAHGASLKNHPKPGYPCGEQAGSYDRPKTLCSSQLGHGKKHVFHSEFHLIRAPHFLGGTSGFGVFRQNHRGRPSPYRVTDPGEIRREETISSESEWVRSGWLGFASITTSHTKHSNGAEKSGTVLRITNVKLMGSILKSRGWTIQEIPISFIPVARGSIRSTRIDPFTVGEPG